MNHTLGITSQGISLVLCHLVLAVVASAAHANSQRPNIIFFLVDDYDKPETSVYGGDVLTPNLDRMAREGMTLTNAHMTSAVCTPSRYTCLTGRYAGASTCEYYLRENPLGQQGAPAFNVELEPDNMNVGQVLKGSGYATGFVGKYHVGSHIDEENATRFDWCYIPKNTEYSADLQRMKQHNQQRACALIRERGFTWVKNIYWENTKSPFKGHNPEWTIDAALDFIDVHKDEPFYLHYATTLLHGPNGEWYRSLSKPLVTDEGMLEKPIGIMDRDRVMKRIRKAGLSENEAGYLWMDDSLGMLLDRLDHHGIAQNTIVVFLADQLYDLVNDPLEQKNVATKPRYSERLVEMKRLLEQELAKFPDRPFGEFIPGGNAVGLEGQTDFIPKLRKFAAAMK